MAKIPIVIGSPLDGKSYVQRDGLWRDVSVENFARMDAQGKLNISTLPTHTHEDEWIKTLIPDWDINADYKQFQVVKSGKKLYRATYNIPAFVQIVSAAWEVIAELPEGKSLEFFSTTKTYFQNDLVVYNDSIYKMQFDEFGPAAWNQTFWKPVQPKHCYIPTYAENVEYLQNEVVYYDKGLYRSNENMTPPLPAVPIVGTTGQTWTKLMQGIPDQAATGEIHEFDSTKTYPVFSVVYYQSDIWRASTGEHAPGVLTSVAQGGVWENLTAPEDFPVFQNGTPYIKDQVLLWNGFYVRPNANTNGGSGFSWGLTDQTFQPVLSNGAYIYQWKGIPVLNAPTTYSRGDVIVLGGSSTELYAARTDTSWTYTTPGTPPDSEDWGIIVCDAPVPLNRYVTKDKISTTIGPSNIHVASQALVTTVSDRVTTADGKITALETRMTTAEGKIPAVPDASPLGLNMIPAIGTAAKYARQDHVHKIPVNWQAMNTNTTTGSADNFVVDWITYIVSTGTISPSMIKLKYPASADGIRMQFAWLLKKNSDIWFGENDKYYDGAFASLMAPAMANSAFCSPALPSSSNVDIDQGASSAVPAEMFRMILGADSTNVYWVNVVGSLDSPTYGVRYEVSDNSWTTGDAGTFPLVRSSTSLTATTTTYNNNGISSTMAALITVPFRIELK